MALESLLAMMHPVAQEDDPDASVQSFVSKLSGKVSSPVNWPAGKP